MLRLFLGILFVVIFSAYAAANERTFRVIGVEPWDHLNIRERPRPNMDITRSRIIGRIPHDAADVLVIGRPIRRNSELWVSVNYRGMIGWVNTRYLSINQGVSAHIGQGDETTAVDKKMPPTAKPTVQVAPSQNPSKCFKEQLVDAFCPELAQKSFANDTVTKILAGNGVSRREIQTAINDFRGLCSACWLDGFADRFRTPDEQRAAAAIGTEFKCGSVEDLPEGVLDTVGQDFLSLMAKCNMAAHAWSQSIVSRLLGK